jgi:hypothetical protein
MTFLTDKYADISRTAVSCYLFVNGLAKPNHFRDPPSIRKQISTLGHYLNRILTEGIDDNLDEPADTEEQACLCGILNGVPGLSLALYIEKDILKGKDRNYEKQTAELRKHGIRGLKSLADVLMKADSPYKFDKYIEGIAPLFLEWHKYADEKCAQMPVALSSSKDLGRVFVRFAKCMKKKKSKK